MPNPSGLVLSNSQNQTQGKHIHNYSTFADSLSYRNYQTMRFGEYIPTFVMEGVERDSISVNTSDKIDSLSLAAPFAGSIRKVKESFKVPMASILPRNWDIIYTQPSNGEDVPTGDYRSANCVIKDPTGPFFTILKGYWAKASECTTMADLCKLILPLLVTGEHFFSNGSLLSSLGYHVGHRFNFKGRSYDSIFDEMMVDLFSHLKYVHVTEDFIEDNYESQRASFSYYGLSSEIGPKERKGRGNIHQFLEYLRYNPAANLDFGFETDYNVKANVTAFLDKWTLASASDCYVVINSQPTEDSYDSIRQNDLNLSRIIAYQIVCAHFYTNSSIDTVYTAELYRQYMESLTEQVTMTYKSEIQSFTLNGFNRKYDALSGCKIMASTLWNTSGAVFSNYQNALSFDVKYRLLYIAQLFGYRRSLRYGDYFVGMRPRPLAPVNTDVAVSSSNKVSVVDITKSIQAQRFANSVMRSRQKVEEYVKALFGRAPSPDYHNPFFLSRESETIYGEDVQNTGEAQQTKAISRTGIFGNNIGRYTFTFDNEDMHPCIYLQIVHFDAKRAYTRTVDRQFLIRDRFDMFNPDFQYVGDQPVLGIELMFEQPGTQSVPSIIGYQGRDAEYKQRFDVASGGFIENLPGWFISDRPLTNVMSSPFINPNFIRSSCGELDPLFLSLTGFSMGSYFHFICITDNNVNARRAMAVDPQILA